MPITHKQNNDSYVNKKDPEPISLLFAILGGIAGVASLCYTITSNVKKKNTSKKIQKVKRKTAKKALQKILANLNEWKDIIFTTRSFYKVGKLKPSSLNFKIGASQLYLTVAEQQRFFKTTDRIHKLQKNTTKECCILQDCLTHIKSLSSNNNEIERIEDLRAQLIKTTENLNQQIFSPVNTATTTYRSHDDVLKALDDFISDCYNSLNKLEVILGSDYDD